MNVTSVGGQPGSMSGVNQFPYGDSGLANDGRMGADILNPAMVQSSGLQQNMPMGQGQNGMLLTACKCSPHQMQKNLWRVCVLERMHSKVD